jgi:quercetin dioxygenase-like cupin family protein
VEFLNDGVVDPRPIVPGDVVYVASEVMHGWTNIGDTPALYFVIEISRKDPAEKA